MFSILNAATIATAAKQPQKTSKLQSFFNLKQVLKPAVLNDASDAAFTRVDVNGDGIVSPMEIYNDPQMRMAYFSEIHDDFDEAFEDGKMQLIEFRIMWMENLDDDYKLTAWETGVPDNYDDEEDYDDEDDWRALLFKNSKTQKTKQDLHKRLPHHFKGIALAANTQDQFSALDTDQSGYLTVEEFSHLEGDLIKKLFISLSYNYDWDNFADIDREEFAEMYKEFQDGGYLEREHTACRNGDVGRSYEQLVAVCDANGDGIISQREARAMAKADIVTVWNTYFEQFEANCSKDNMTDECWELAEFLDE
jgi:Ca2+-binding EF-hand superfamily protein